MSHVGPSQSPATNVSFAGMAWLLVSLLASPPVSAQATTGLAPATIASLDDREVAYAALARDVDAMERELGIVKRVVKLVSPAVVHIEATPLPRYRGHLEIEEAGSGVIVRFGKRFYVLSNRHVIRHSTEKLIEIHLADGRITQPRRIWSDKETDVAVMAIDTSRLVAAKIGNSDAMEIGDYVLAIGSPFGLSQSVTRGIISAKGRHNLELGDNELILQNFIQTDAAINPGNSGGPLVNLRGEVIGLNTAIASSGGGNEGIGFSIPVNIASRIAQQLVKGEHVARGFLGVKLDVRFSEARAKAKGLHRLMGTHITGIEPQSPAARADLQVGDVILKFNGIQIDRDTHLISLVQLSEVGKRAELIIYRDGKPLRKYIHIGNMQSE